MLPLIAIVGPTTTLHQLLINPLSSAGFPLLVLSDVVDVLAVLCRTRPSVILLDMWSYVPSTHRPLLEVLEQDAALATVPRIVVTTEWKNVAELRAALDRRGSRLLAYPFDRTAAIAIVRQALGEA